MNPTVVMKSQDEVYGNKQECVSISHVLRRRVKLKEKIQEYEVLNRHIQTENELCKTWNTHLQAKVERLKERQRKLH